MNSTHVSTPDTASPHWADAVCAIGIGSELFTGSGNEQKTYWNGTLISPTKILTCAHAFGDQSAGYHALAQGQVAGARICRFRRLTNGTFVGGAVCVGYHQIAITGYTVPPDAQDIAVADLATPVTHITPIGVYTGSPAAAQDVEPVGWGLDGATIGAGSWPGDARMIDTAGPSPRTCAAAYTNEFGRVHSMGLSGTIPGPNQYDSGAPWMIPVSGTRYVAGVFSSAGVAVAVEQYKNTPGFGELLPGIYTPGSVDPPNPSFWITSNDTYMQESLPTADYSTQTQIVCYAETGKTTDTDKMVFAGFSLASVVGTIIRVQLILIGTVNIGDLVARFRRIRRTGVTHLANWNTYDGTNNWGTAGANNTTTDVYTTNQFTHTFDGPSAEDTEFVVDSEDHPELLAMVNAARIDDGVLRLLIESTQTDAAALTAYSVDHVIQGGRARLVVTTDEQWPGRRREPVRIAAGRRFRI